MSSEQEEKKGSMAYLYAAGALIILFLIGLWAVFLSMAFLPSLFPPLQETCYINFETPADRAGTCSQIATDSFEEMCNDVLADHDLCMAIWEGTEVSFDPDLKICYISLPVDCEKGRAAGLVE